MWRLDQGETFVVTRNGKSVGELSPLRRLRSINTENGTALFHHVPPIDLVETAHDKPTADLLTQRTQARRRRRGCYAAFSPD